MKRHNYFLAASVLILLSLIAVTLNGQGQPAPLRADKDGLALTPPMGWYPWNEFGQEPQNEQFIKEITDALIRSGMKDAGYVYVGPDEGICFRRGTDGHLTPNLDRYPSGLKGLGDYIHQHGLKYALYTDAGARTCSKAMPGTEGHEFDDMAAFAAWRADYVKIDWCNTQGLAVHSPPQGESARDPRDVEAAYTVLGHAQLAAGRPIVFSLCSWGFGEPWKWAAAVGHLWRTTGDICNPGKADWDKAMRNTALNEKLYSAAGPGHWNDPDMLINGMNDLSDARNRSFFSLWCMMAAPLMAGNDLRNMSNTVLAIMTNREAIGIDQDPLGIQGRIVRTEGAAQIWAAKRLFDGSQAVLVFNPGAEPARVHLAWQDLGFESASLYIRDLWTHQTSGPQPNGVTVTVPPNDVAFLRVSKTRDFALPPVIVADTYLLTFAAEAGKPLNIKGIVNLRSTGTDPLPPWKVRDGLPGWLQVAAGKKGSSQALVNTVSTAGLAPGHYHAEVRADNTEPRSHLPMSALYYDVDLEVSGGSSFHAGR